MVFYHLKIFGAEGATPPETLRQMDRNFFDILESSLGLI